MPQKRKTVATLISFFSVIFMITVSISLAGSGPNMQEGLWEITTKMDMPGMPMSMPATKHTQCITKENIVPESYQPDQECRITKTKVLGDTVTWTVECDSPEGKSRLTGQITYHGDKFEGTINITMEGMEIIQHMSGRRIGDCKQ